MLNSRALSFRRPINMFACLNKHIKLGSGRAVEGSGSKVSSWVQCKVTTVPRQLAIGDLVFVCVSPKGFHDTHFQVSKRLPLMTKATLKKKKPVSSQILTDCIFPPCQLPAPLLLLPISFCRRLDCRLFGIGICPMFCSL